MNKYEMLNNTTIEHSLEDMRADASIVDKEGARKWVLRNFDLGKNDYLEHGMSHESYVDFLRKAYKRTAQQIFSSQPRL